MAVIQLRAEGGKNDRWALPLVAVAAILAVVAGAGRAGGLEPLGAKLTDDPPFLLLSLLAFAAGIQNAAVASTTGMAVRTTHLTGPTTDMGMLVGAACLSRGAARRAALGGALLRLGIVLAFAGGAGLALPLTGWAGYLALLAPAAAVLIAARLSFVPDEAQPDSEADPGLMVAIPADARAPGGGGTAGDPAG